MRTQAGRGGVHSNPKYTISLRCLTCLGVLNPTGASQKLFLSFLEKPVVSGELHLLKVKATEFGQWQSYNQGREACPASSTLASLCYVRDTESAHRSLWFSPTQPSGASACSSPWRWRQKFSGEHIPERDISRKRRKGSKHNLEISFPLYLSLSSKVAF